MPLFHCKGQPMKFYLTGLEGTDLTALKDLITRNGGVVTEDKDSIIKFTSAKICINQHFSVARVYDFRFIMEADKLRTFPEPAKFRLNPKEDDEYIIHHFLYGHCNKLKMRKKKEINYEDDPSCVRYIVIDRDQKEFLREHGMQTDDVTCLDSPQLNPNDETLVETLQTSNLAETRENEKVVNELSFPRREIDESQAVLSEVEMINNRPLTGAGDIGEINRSPRNRNEKRPCNVEYELNVKSKLKELMNKQKAMDAAKKDLSPSGNRHLTRSPRTRTKRNSERLSNEFQVSNDEINHLEEESNEVMIIPQAEISSKNDCTIVDISDSPIKDMEIEPNLLAETENESNECPRDDNSENVKKGEKNGKSNKRMSDENRPSTSKGYKSPRKNNGDLNGAIDKRIMIKANDNQNNVGNKNGKKRLKTINVEFDDSDSDESLKSLPSTSSGSNYLTATSSADVDIIWMSSPSKNRPNRKRSLSLNEAGPSGVVKNKKPNHSEANDEKNEAKEKTKTKKPNNQKSSKIMWENSSDVEVTGDNDEEGINGNYFDDDNVDDIVEETVARKKRRPVENSTAKCKEWRDRMKAQLRRRKVARRAFDATERNAMLKYLIERKKIKYAKGLVVWKEMIEDGILDHRTPGSLQNHFKKYILPNIEHARIDEASLREFLKLRID